MMNGAVEKVRIFAYSDKLMQPNTSVGQPFYIPLNPENYSRNFKIETDDRRGHGDQGTDPRYKNTVPEDLQLEFILDGTGTIENYRYTDPSKKSVKEQFKLFLETVYWVNSETHRPNFLKIHWGKYLQFPCILSNLDVNYQLFESNGDPLRLKISATFKSYLAPEERAARMRTSSPDLTHERVTKAGDRLDLMTHNIYADTKYLLQVASVNGLTTFRRLDSGMKLRFPPISKTGA